MSQTVANEKQLTLLDLLDRAIYKGVVLNGDITISVANVDLVYLGLKLLLTSVDRIEEMRKMAAEQAFIGYSKVEL